LLVNLVFGRPCARMSLALRIDGDRVLVAV
jgi:hypothetical protein